MFRLTNSCSLMKKDALADFSFSKYVLNVKLCTWDYIFNCLKLALNRTSVLKYIAIRNSFIIQCYFSKML